MKTPLPLCLILAATTLAAQAAPLETGFTYQGLLTEAGKPNPGKFNFEHYYDLYDSPTGGLRVAGPVTNNVEVIDGVFTTVINFGPNIFDGRQYWLEIGVRTNRNVAFITLVPRQPVRPTPYALHALSSAGVTPGSVSNAALALNAVSADKIAPGNVLKSLNGLTDSVELVAEGDLVIRQDRNQLVLAALPSCLTYSNCYWNLRGNGNITAGVNFLGTIAGELDPLEFRVNNNRSLLHVFTAASTAPNLIGGYQFNSISGIGGTISGGGQASGVNRVLASWGTIGGGFTNIIQTNATGSFIGGGATNLITGPYGTIGGGGMNISSNSSFVGGGVLNRSVSEGGVIGGGYSNLVASYDSGGVTIPSVYSVVSGGVSNTITGGAGGSVGGGLANRIVGTGGRQVNYATIAGGQGNAVLSDSFTSYYSSIGGGFSNRISTANRATIGGGDGSRILLEGHSSTIGGGQGHTLDGPYGTISGGRSNVVVGPGNPDYGAIGGGDQNAIVADSHYATIAGGQRNRIQGFANNSSIGGGATNAITGADFATIGGGGTNAIADNANFATIGGGRGNSISPSATNATISGGRANLVDTSAPFAAIPGGQQARATNYNQYAFGSGSFSQTGDAQHSQYVLRNTSQGTNSVELFLDGALREIVLWPSSVLTFDILLVGVSGNDSAGYQVRGVIERNGAGISFVGIPTTTTLGEDILAWGVSVQPDPVNNSLSIFANGAGNAVVRWVAHVRTVEVRL